jgi:plastocyanin
MAMRNLISVVLVAIAGLASAQEAGTFRAQVLIQHPNGNAGSQANVVAWLTPLGDTAREVVTQPAHARLLQKNKQFEPRLLVLPVGSLVDFPNQDPFFHNVFSLYKGKRFDLGLYESGTSRTVHFDRPGVSFIFCNIHPEMSAAVVVVPTPYFAVSNGAGEISIRDVRPGHYRLEVWYERSSPKALATLTRELTLPLEKPLPALRVSEVIEGEPGHKNKYGKDYDASHPYEPPP